MEFVVKEPPVTAAGAAARRELRRLQHQDLNRTQLLDAAEVVFGDRGFNRATLKQIAELAGFAVGSVYSFFTSKEDLFREVVARRGREFVDRMQQVCDRDASALERLHDVIDLQVGIFREHPHFGRIYLNFANTAGVEHGATVDETVQARFDRAMAMQADLIREGQRAGDVRAGDPFVLGRIFSGMVFAFQSLDPMVVSDDPDRQERMPVAALHDVIEAALRR